MPATGACRVAGEARRQIRRPDTMGWQEGVQGGNGVRARVSLGCG